jgi:hypothetical protein
MCRATWGVGLDTLPINRAEACRRLYVDMLGRFPSRHDVGETCGDDSKPWGDVVSALLDSDEFVRVNQRLWADRLLYNNETVNVERIFDMDELVGKLYRGLVSYDEFAAVVSAHPVLTRRYNTPADRAEALFNLFMGRPPYANERADMARLYVLWDNGYYDHPNLGRVPDAMIKFTCIDENGHIDATTRGECTSILWGYHELILRPDARAHEGEMWSGLLLPEEWEKLEAPGRVISQQLGFWEHAVDMVVDQYLGYDLDGAVPGVREELVKYLLQYNGDIRAVHHALATSFVYLQSTVRPGPASDLAASPRWTYGPLKQVLVEPWLDSIKQKTGYTLAQCDHRISEPELLLESGFVGAYAVVDKSRWTLSSDGIVSDYRDIAQTLGGCPDNQTGGRFTAVSILSTAVQQSLVQGVCNPALDPEVQGADIARLLPQGMTPGQALDADTAHSILVHQVGLFFGRPETKAESDEALAAVDECTPKPCSAEAFARPLCYALLSSSEYLFY